MDKPVLLIGMWRTQQGAAVFSRSTRVSCHRFPHMCSACVLCAEGGKENLTLAEVLNQAKLPVLDFNTCHHKKFWGNKMRPTMLCAGLRDNAKSPAACQVQKSTNPELPIQSERHPFTTVVTVDLEWSILWL